MTRAEERKIRRHRRELKRAEREHRRAEREERRRRQEVARNANLAAEPGCAPLRELIGFVYHTVCEKCGTVKKSNEMWSDAICNRCHYAEEVKQESETKERETGSDPGEGIGGTKSLTAKGQLTFSI